MSNGSMEGESQRKQYSLSLMEEREEEMVSFVGSNREPTKRKAWFLKPTSHSTFESCSPLPFPPPNDHRTIDTYTKEEAAEILSFHGWLGGQPQWGDWVDKLKPKYSDLWKQVGIFDAIKATTFKIQRDQSSVYGLIRFWCKETNTFLFPWAEATITLQDVMILGGFSLLGEPVRVSKELEGELQNMESKIIAEVKRFNRTKAKKADICQWIKHYVEEGQCDEVEHTAFLALWLSRYAFPGHPGRVVRESMISIAVRLAHGERLALAPAVLANIYRDLRVIKDHLSDHGGSPLAILAPFTLLQLWVWERFSKLSPQPKVLADSDQPRAARWHGVSRVGNKLPFTFIMSVLTSSDEFQWQPYTNQAFSSKSDGKWISWDGREDDELASFARCLRDCELVSVDCIEQYLPHRVARQFGYDQDVPLSVPRSDMSWDVAWESYDIRGRNITFYIPPRIFEPNVTLQYSIWWKKEDERMRGKKRNSVTNSEEEEVRDVDDIVPLSEGASNKKSCTEDNRPSPNGREIIIGCTKNRDGDEYIYDLLLQESAEAKARRLKRDEEIEQLKEEIALTQAKLKLTSEAEVDNAANKP